MKKTFGLGLLVGIILTVIAVWVFKHKLAKWYAGRYGTHFAEALEKGVEKFVEDIGKGIYIPLPLN